MLQRSLMVSALALGLAATATPAPAQDNMEKLGQFKTTGTSMDMELVPQTGEYADGLKKTLERIKMPAGFKIGLYAVVPDARHMAVGPSTGMVFAVCAPRVCRITAQPNRPAPTRLRPAEAARTFVLSSANLHRSHSSERRGFVARSFT